MYVLFEKCSIGRRNDIENDPLLPSGSSAGFKHIGSILDSTLGGGRFTVCVNSSVCFNLNVCMYGLNLEAPWLHCTVCEAQSYLYSNVRVPRGPFWLLVTSNDTAGCLMIYRLSELLRPHTQTHHTHLVRWKKKLCTCTQVVHLFLIQHI